MVLLTAILFVSISSAAPQDRVLGLLTLPQVFGEGPCHEFVPEEVPIYPVMGSDDPVAAIRVTRYWTFPDAGGCEGLSVHVYDMQGERADVLPTQEFDYEAPAALVLEARKGWFRIQLLNGSAWVKGTEVNEYHALETLLYNGLTFIAAASGAVLLARPDGLDVVAKASPGDSVRIVDFSTIDQQLWLLVEVLNHSVCLSADEPEVVSEGWMPAHGSSGQPTVWFYSRGC